MKSILLIATCLLVAIPAEATGFGKNVDNDIPARPRPAEPERPDEPGEIDAPTGPTGLRYVIEATNGRLNRRLMDEPRRFVQGVPAEPVDSMVWNGEGSTPIEGSMRIEVEPMRNLGTITARWVDRNGTWTYRQTRFIHPDHHVSGVRLSSSVNYTQGVLNEGISHNVYMHGDTTAGMPVVPTVAAFLATWGPADVTLNGRPFNNPFEIPAPQWSGHTMVTEGVRRADGTVRTLDNTIYNPSHAANGATDPADIEAHLAFGDDLFPATTNIPPLHSFLYHLVFENVKITIVQGDE